jgi:4-amino-4-deoxy-L-arabinose transferase-like glycosyltransferase
MALESHPTHLVETRSGRRVERPVWLALGVLLVSLVWRLPSIFDPPWVNDEGTYFAVAQAMAHGYHLYGGVWENKPPALYLLYSAVYHLVGPSLLTIRLLSCVAALGLVGTVLLLARWYVGVEYALVAGMVAGLLLGVPFLEGTTGNAELFMAVLTTLAVYLALVRNRPALAGAGMAVAMCFKVVAGFDAAALGLWLLLHRRERLAPYAVALCALGGLVLGLCGMAGILPAMLQDALLYPLGYVGHTNGGSAPWLLAAKLAALAGATFLLRRAPFPYLWTVYAALGALSSGRFFGHYALQVVPPIALSAALLLQGRKDVRTVLRREIRDSEGTGEEEPLRRRVLALLCALPIAFLAAGLGSAVVGWRLAASGHDSILARRLQYYVNFARWTAGDESYQAYRAQIDDHVNRNLRVSHELTRLPSGTLLVWGNVPWVYVLSDRLPTTPYTSASREPEVPGETATLRRSVALGIPRVVVVVYPPKPAIGLASLALTHRYRRVDTVDSVAIYLRRP